MTKEEKYLRDNAVEVLNLSHSKEGRELINHIRDYVKEACGDLTTYQLRQMFATIRNAKDPMELQLVRPNIAYLGARQESSKVRDVVLFLDFFMEQVQTPSHLTEFKNLMEAIVAYHKLQFGNKNQ